MTTRYAQPTDLAHKPRHFPPPRTLAMNAYARMVLTTLCLLAATTAVADEDPGKISFKSKQLDAKLRSEGTSIGYFNGDGKLDISAGSVYYAAPDWKMVPVLDKPAEFDPHNYSNSFCNFAADINKDGRTDL